MPLPRKNVEPSRKRDDDSEDVVVTTRKRQLFDWDDMGLGLEVPLSSSESVYSDSSSERGDFELQTASSKQNDVHQPTFEWVRNLIDCRKAKHQKAALDDHAFRTTGRGWLRDQHKALEDGTIPVTFKCIIAASGISKVFNKCRDDFRKPEYRSRYWSWSVNFILLIDHFIDCGNISVTEKASKKYQALLPYLAQCKEQKKQGNLSTERDRLLTALGMVWDSEESSSDEDEESSDESYGDSQADETWEMPSKHKSSRPKRSLKARNSRKRKRKALNREAMKPKSRDESPPPYRLPVIPVRRSLTSWAQQMLAVRRHYRKQRGEDDLYDIPSNQLSLRIWMNAETARCSTGALSDVCCGILKAAEMADAEDVGQLDPECEAWAKGFVAFLDFFIRKKKPRDEAVNFLYSCRRSALNGTLASDRDALLRGVDENWFESEEMKACVFIKEKKRSEMLTRARDAENVVPTQEVDEFNGQVVEVVLDSGTNYIDDSVARKKRKKTAMLVRQKLSSMIGGEVAVTVEGRNPTAAERDAKEWVLRAGAKAFDVYARNWFRAAIAEKY